MVDGYPLDRKKSIAAAGGLTERYGPRTTCYNRFVRYCLGRFRGGLTTKIHAVVDRQGLPLRLGLTAGQAHDAPAALMLLAMVKLASCRLWLRAYESTALYMN